MSRGYFGIGIENTKNAMNVGTLWRSANILGASFIFTIGRRYKRQSSDTLETWRHIPLFTLDSFEEFYKFALPYDCRLVGIEMEERATPIKEYKHHQRAVYLLGSEDNGLSKNAIDTCHDLIVLPGKFSLNVAVAGSLVMFDRINKSTPQEDK